MKRVAVWACSILMLFSLCACGKTAENTTLTVFAAASLQETLTEVGAQYMAQHEGVEVVFSFDSSGTLKRQIEEGAYCDVFVSAAQKQMDELDCVVEESRVDLLENKVSLAVPEGNPAAVADFADMSSRLASGELFLAMGNADVPVGQYTGKIFRFYGLDEASLASGGCLTYGSNAKEVTTHVSEAMADCGIVYATDAVSAGLTVVDTATEEMCGRVIYPAAVLTGSVQRSLAQDFLDFCRSDAAMDVFSAVGFSPAA